MFIINKWSTTDDIIGAIILWHGLAVDVPSGWEIYAPAKDAFVMGAAAGELDTTPTGGNTHSHNRSSGNTGSVPNHSHSWGFTSTVAASTSSNSGLAGTSIGVAGASHRHVVTGGTFSAAGAHTHTVSATNSQSHLPQYHRLYWIRRVL